MIAEVQNLTKTLREDFEDYRKSKDPLIQEKISAVESRINTLEEKLEQALAARNKTQFPTESDSEPVQEFSYAKALRGIVFSRWDGAEREQKALSEGTDSAGGYLVPPEQARELIDLLRARTVFNNLPVTRYTPTFAPFDLPRLASGATGYMVGENTDITASQPSFDQVRLTPKKAAGLVPISNNLIRRADPAVDQIVRNDLVAVIARLLDLQYLQGDGSGGNLTGIINTSGVNEVSLGEDGGTPSIDTLYDALYEVERNNGMATAWVFHPRTKNTLRKIKTTDGQYILQPQVSASEPPTLLGLPYYTTTQIPINLTVGGSTDCSYIIVGQWSEAVIAEWMGLQLEASREASYFDGSQLQSAFSRDQTVIRAILEVDFALRQPKAFCKVTGVRP